MAAERASEEELKLISEACEEMAATSDNVEEFLVADRKFHTGILHATGNPFFSPVANVISVSLEGSLRVTNRHAEENRESVPLHRKVMNSICGRNTGRARSAMTALLSHAARRMDVARPG